MRTKNDAAIPANEGDGRAKDGEVRSEDRDEGADLDNRGKHERYGRAHKVDWIRDRQLLGCLDQKRPPTRSSIGEYGVRLDLRKGRGSPEL